MRPMCSSGAKTVLIKAKRSTVTDLLTMLAYYETTTHLHELSGSEKEKRVLSYIVLGHPFDAPEPPKQAIVYHHGKPCSLNSRQQVSLHSSSSKKHTSSSSSSS